MWNDIRQKSGEELNVISIFPNIDIKSASIVLPKGKKSQINNQRRDFSKSRYFTK